MPNENKIFIIAEIGHNHMGYMRHAKLLIDEAKACGVDAVKFQAYDTNKIKKPWQSRYYELLLSEHTKEEFQELKDYCDKIGIEFFSSAFDSERVGWLEGMGVKRHKLASRSIYDTELIQSMEATGKPIIASLGYWKDPSSLPVIKNSKFLYCISEYPAYLKDLPAKFGDNEKYQGFSDHSIGTYWIREAVKRGATIIEKHFTLDRRLPGNDQKGSADPTDMKDFVKYAREVERGVTY
jgi:N,N'-diacetyllegionaminate synthase